MKLISSLVFVAILIPTLARAQCGIVAVVFDTTICQEDITFQNSKDTFKPMSPETKSKIEKNRLAQMIRNIAAEHLLARESYTPSDQEIDSYLSFLDKSGLTHRSRNKELIGTIEHLLETNQYTEIHRKRLENALTIFRKSEEQSMHVEEGNRLRDEDMRRSYGEDAVKEFHKKLKRNRRKIAKQVVYSWKMNKALYEKYGGRVIFQQAGIEPIDAYRDQLRDIYEMGGLRIVKLEYTDVFGDFERYLDMGHNYLSENGKKYFGKPYWETTDLDKNHQAAIDEYMAIPHK